MTYGAEGRSNFLFRIGSDILNYTDCLSVWEIGCGKVRLTVKLYLLVQMDFVVAPFFLRTGFKIK